MFKGLGNLANIGALVKQAQEMGGRMQALQEELKTKKATGAAGGGPAGGMSVPRSRSRFALTSSRSRSASACAMTPSRRHWSIRRRR